jgi:hypothetical protein
MFKSCAPPITAAARLTPPEIVMTETVAPETVALARRLALQGLTAAAIRKQAGVTAATLRACVSGKIDDGSGEALAPIALRRKPGARRRSGRGTLVARLWRSAEQQVDDIEARLARVDQLPAEQEGNARALGALVKTLRELAAFDETQASRQPKKTKQPTASAHDDDPVPRDIDEFRRELARKMEDFIRSRDGDGVPRVAEE